jgi:diguanylate cyclase (GGDEF)-like protein
MNPEILEKVLSCKRIPSLPAVALRVLELTQDKNVSFNELADTITNDIGLASKVLRTVNSSFYALRKPCGSINQAIVMLGLSAVKTLALGFSLVSSIAKVQGEGFDLQTYWRRTLVSGIAAKCVAGQTRIGNDEECFLGGLLQDVGMIAMFMALEQDYVDVLKCAGEDHSQLTKEELAVFGVSHADIGAQLATRWKLPSELIMPIRYHERPTAAPPENLRQVQAVALGSIAAEVINSPEPAVALKRFYQRAEQWFGLRNNQADDIIKAATTHAKDIARLLQVDIGEVRGVDEMRSKAQKQLADIALPFEPQAAAGESTDLDPLTGLPARKSLNQNMVAAFEQAVFTNTPFALALVEIDQLTALASQGQPMVDAAISEVCARLKTLACPPAVLLCRYDDTRLAMLFPSADRLNATRQFEQIRTSLAQSPIEVAPPGLMKTPIGFSLSAGLAAIEQQTREKITDPDELLSVCERALASARKAGQNTLRVYTPKAA